MRIVFMGTPDFSVPVLDALIAGGPRDRRRLFPAAAPGGPRQEAAPDRRCRPAPRRWASRCATRNPARRRGAGRVRGARRRCRRGGRLWADPAAGVLDAPAHGCLNIHASLLPRWRGAAPIHRAVMAGDAETGVCIMQMEAGLDTGPVLLREALPIGPDGHDRRRCMTGLAGAGRAADRRGAGAARRASTPQAAARSRRDLCRQDRQGRGAHRLDPPADEVDRLIRGLSPFPGAWCEMGGERVKLLLRALADGEGAPGTVLATA